MATFPKKHNEEEQDWEDPNNPEKPLDDRDAEQLERQKEEAERRKENLTDDSEKNENQQKN